MQVYLARVASKHSNDNSSIEHDIIGIFAVNRYEDLFWFVDEACDPGIVEVLLLKAGGIFWPDATFKIPIPTDEEGQPLDAGPVIPPGANLCEGWERSFFDDVGKWRRVIDPDRLD